MRRDVRMVAISGNTYPIKDQIRALGGRWDADARCWRVPEDKADEARALVAGAPKQPQRYVSASARYAPPRRRSRDYGERPTDELPEGHVLWSRGEGYGGEAKSVGEVLAAGGYGFSGPELPAGTYWRVTHAWGWYCDDEEMGMSVGVGDERGYIHYARVRPATEEESAPVRAHAAAAQLRREAREELERIAKQIHQEGEYPREAQRLEGDWLLIPGSGNPLYGRGEWLVITGEALWAVQNNGMDGDDWARNNVSTGGAGGIGRRVPHDAELAARIRELAAAAGGER